MNSIEVKREHIFNAIALSAGRSRSPEVSLWLAVIRQAISDALDGDDKNRNGAREFLKSKRLDAICSAINIDASFVRECVAKHKTFVTFADHG